MGYINSSGTESGESSQNENGKIVCDTGSGSSGPDDEFFLM